MEETEKITISKYEYDTLNTTKIKYNILMQHIFYGDLTDLTYDDKLSINGNSTMKIVKVLEPVWYEQVVRKYKTKEEENGSNK